MASAVFSRWVAAGKPVEPAQPVRDVVDRMKAGYPRAAATFGWYANDTHYEAVPPGDHTPYSADGWPVPDQPWYVYATDIMHRPDLGVDCNVLFAYWLVEARAGRFPGLKYLIWQATIYDVRYGWKPQANSGHFDHIHLSFRTDWQTKSLGSWSLLPQEDDMLEGLDRAQVNNAEQYPRSIVEWTDQTQPISDTVHMNPVPNRFKQAFSALAGDVAAIKAAVAKPAPTPLALTSSDRAAIVADLLAALKGEIRDAVADLGEGGATKVRADG